MLFVNRVPCIAKDTIGHRVYRVCRYIYEFRQFLQRKRDCRYVQSRMHDPSRYQFQSSESFLSHSLSLCTVILALSRSLLLNFLFFFFLPLPIYPPYREKTHEEFQHFMLDFFFVYINLKFVKGIKQSRRNYQSRIIE